MMISARRWLAALAAVALLGGCKGQANVVEHCAEPDAGCPACSAATDCVFTGNACTSTVYCTHRNASIAVIEIGCDPAVEYSWPDEEQCACVNTVCQYTE